MVDGRVYTPEDQLEADREELRAAERHLARMERAGIESRVVNEPEWNRSLRRLRARVDGLRRAVAEAEAADLDLDEADR